MKVFIQPLVSLSLSLCLVWTRNARKHKEEIKSSSLLCYVSIEIYLDHCMIFSNIFQIAGYR